VNGRPSTENKVKESAALEAIQIQLNKLEARQVEQEAKNRAQEQKIDQTNHIMLEEIKKANEQTKQSVIQAVVVALEKTNKEVTNIQHQVTEVKTKNDSFDAVMKYFHYYMNKDTQYKNDVLDKAEDMTIDKENYKRNAHGALRDENGHQQRLLCENNTTALGGNHNNCNNVLTDHIGNRHP
jgi:hypothetical protein